MARIEAMISETAQWRECHRLAYLKGHKGRSVDAAVCAIREKALRECLNIVNMKMVKSEQPEIPMDDKMTGTTDV